MASLIPCRILTWQRMPLDLCAGISLLSPGGPGTPEHEHIYCSFNQKCFDRFYLENEGAFDLKLR